MTNGATMEQLQQKIHELEAELAACKNPRKEVCTWDELRSIARRLVVYNDGRACLDPSRLGDGVHRLLGGVLWDVLWVVDIEGDILYGSPSAVDVVGVDPREVLGSDMRGLFSLASRSRMDAVLERRLAFRQAHPGEEAPFPFLQLSFCHADGHEMLVETCACFIEDGIGTPVGMVGVLRDLTVRRKIAEEPCWLRRFLQMVLEQSSVPTFVVDDRHRVLYWNRACERLTGTPAVEVEGTRETWRGFYAAPRPVILDRLLDGWSEAEIRREYGPVWKMQDLDEGMVEAEIFFADMAPEGRWLHVSATVLRDEQGRIIGGCEFVLDVTARRVAEKERREIAEHLWRGQKLEALGTMSAGIAHEFNNILGSIFLNTELALLDVEEGTPVHDSMDSVLLAAHRARDLVHQILTFSRQNPQQYQELQMAPIVKEALKLLRASLPDDVILEESVSTEGHVDCDATEIHQFVLNLCNNAVHAMREGGGRLRVCLEDVTLDASAVALDPELHGGGYVRLTVEDSGEGMDEETRERLFDPFYTTRAPGQGAGLGLAVVHGIVQKCQGAVVVESAPGHGARLEVYLPRVYPRQADQPETCRLRGNGERLLVVDDEEQLARLMGRALQRLGYEVSVEADSCRALERIREAPEDFDLLFTDLSMPGMSGTELAAAVQDIRALPVIFCTGYDEHLDEEQVARCGVCAVMIKPVSHSQLAETIGRVLGGVACPGC